MRRRTTTIRLEDGPRMLLRPVMPQDKQAFVDGFARLSPRSRYRRFLSPIEELTPETLRRLTEVDYVDHFAWVALLADEPGVGVARYVRVPGSPEGAEAAVTVIDEYQGRGIGTLFLRALARPRSEANAFRGAVGGTARRECLDHVFVSGRRHLQRVLGAYAAHYNRTRPHPNLDLQPPDRGWVAEPMSGTGVLRRDVLGGLIHEYERGAA